MCSSTDEPCHGMRTRTGPRLDIGQNGLKRTKSTKPRESARTHRGVRLPSVKEFADRQLQILKHDNLDPGSCNEYTERKCGLSRARWKALEDWRKWIERGGLSKKPALRKAGPSA
jgi:hypothetical protein